jgi:hypothetical protein
MLAAEHRLFFINIYGCHARPSSAQRALKRVGFDQPRPAVPTSSASGFMRARSAALTIPRGIHQPHVQRDHIRFGEDRLAAARDLVVVVTRLGDGRFASPHPHVHANALPYRDHFAWLRSVNTSVFPAECG